MTAQNSTPTKVCTGCKADMPATRDFFPPHKKGRYGLHPRCIPCKKVADAADRAKPEQKARQQAWRDANKAKVRETNKAYRDAGYSSTAAVSAWRAENLDEARKQSAARQRKYRREKLWFALKTRVSSMIRLNIARFTPTGRKRRGTRTEEVLGYSVETLCAHIEAQFTEGMTWEKLLAGEIHIDHIVPVSFFKAGDPDSLEFGACWALENLRPMWAKENIAKGAKYDPEDVANRLPRLVDAATRREVNRTSSYLS